MANDGARIQDHTAPKSEKGKSPYLDTQLLQQDLVGKYRRNKNVKKTEDEQK